MGTLFVLVPESIPKENGDELGWDWHLQVKFKGITQSNCLTKMAVLISTDGQFSAFSNTTKMCSVNGNGANSFKHRD